MGDIVNINSTTDTQLLERFKRLEDIIPECMNGVPVNPLIQHIRENGNIRVSLIEFFNHSEFLELLTPGLLLISQELFDKNADTEWYKLMLYIIEEKDDIEAFCENITLCIKKNIDCETAREIVEKSTSSSDMANELTMYTDSYSEMVDIDMEKRCKELEEQCEKLEKQLKECNEEKIVICQNYDLERAALEEQLQNAFSNRQATYNHYIEQKRVSLKYKFLVEKLQKEIADISALKAKCEELENTIVNLKEEKIQLESRVTETLSNMELLQTTCREQTETIQSLNNLLSQKEAIPETIIVEPEEEVTEFPDSQMISFENGAKSVEKKSNWFTNLIAQHSKKAFFKNSRQDQESMIFIKMMEMHYPNDKMQKVKKSLTENVPCFDLYKLICKNPSIEELDEFFAEYAPADAAFV